MLIYNMTMNVDENIHLKWKQWLDENYIPSMLNTKKFSKALVTQVMVNEEMGGITYSIQFTAPTKSHLEAFQEVHKPKVESKFQQFKGKVVFFSSVLKVVSEH